MVATPPGYKKNRMDCLEGVNEDYVGDVNEKTPLVAT